MSRWYSIPVLVNNIHAKNPENPPRCHVPLRKMQPGVEVNGIQNPSEFFILAVNAVVSFTYQQKFV